MNETEFKANQRSVLRLVCFIKISCSAICTADKKRWFFFFFFDSLLDKVLRLQTNLKLGCL